MKNVYEYYKKFINNLIVTKEILNNDEMLCKEYEMSQTKLEELENERMVIIDNICNRLNYIFDIRPRWYRKGFVIHFNEGRNWYILSFPKIDKDSKEYHCFKYLWKELTKEYPNMLYRDFYDGSYCIKKI